MHSHYLFEINGRISLPEKNAPGSDEIVRTLNRRKDLIEEEISNELLLRIKLFSDAHIRPRISIDFQQGSILLTGLAVLDVMGRISGGISLIEYALKAVQWSVKKVIRSEIPDTQEIVVEVRSMQNTSAEPSETRPNSLSILNLSPSQVLIGITMLNIIFFLGGTLFNAFQVDSIQKRYEEANQKVAQAGEKYLEASKVLNDTKSVYMSGLGEIDNARQQLNIQKQRILNGLSIDTMNVSGQIALTKQGILAMNDRITRMNNDLIISEKEVLTLKDKLIELQNSNVQFNLTDIWIHMNFTLRLILITLIVSCIITFVVPVVSWLRGK